MSDEVVRKYLTMDRAIVSQREAFQALGDHTAVLANRVTLDGVDGSVAFSYLARISAESAAVSKFGSVNPRNAERGEPTISATVYVLDPDTGRPTATIEATELTTIRTAAASAVAVDHLAPVTATTLGIIGTGVQARAHAIAISEVRDLRKIYVGGRSIRRAKHLADALAPLVQAEVSATPIEDAASAHIVATCTTSVEPVIESSWIRPGATVISVGAFAPGREELPSSLLQRANHVVVDDVATASGQSGSVMSWLSGSLGGSEGARPGLVSLGDVVVGRAPGRAHADELVVYLSVGLGVQDAAAAIELLRGVSS